MPDLTEYTFECIDDFSTSPHGLARLSSSAGHLFREHWRGMLFAVVFCAAVLTVFAIVGEGR